MIDESFDRIVDWMCWAVPKRFRLSVIRMSRNALGWRLILYIGTLIRLLAHAVKSIRSEERVDIILHGLVAGVDAWAARLTGLVKGSAERFARLDAAGLRLRLTSSLFLCVLASIGVMAVGGGEMAMCALTCMLLFLADGIEVGYRPVCGRIRQRYLAAMLLHALGLSAMLLPYFLQYLMRKFRSNVMLQSTMVIMLGAHVLMFLILIAFNRRQPLFLRVMTFLLGVGPALVAAAAFALFASDLTRPPLLLAAAFCRMLGAGAAFVGDRMLAVMTLGGIRLRYGAVWLWLLETGGLSLMILGAWLCA